VVQELHLVSAHVLCEYVDVTLPAVLEPTGTEPAAAPVPVRAAAYARPGPTRPSGVEALVLGGGAGTGADT
jgi:D-sedoheptulose 7-phosphate isomerase